MLKQAKATAEAPAEPKWTPQEVATVTAALGGLNDLLAILAKRTLYGSHTQIVLQGLTAIAQELAIVAAEQADDGEK